MTLCARAHHILEGRCVVRVVRVEKKKKKINESPTSLTDLTAREYKKNLAFSIIKLFSQKYIFLF